MNLNTQQKVNLSKAFTKFLQTLDFKERPDKYNHEKLDCERYPAIKLEAIKDIVRVTRVSLGAFNKDVNKEFSTKNLPLNAEPISLGTNLYGDEQDLSLNLLISCLNSIEMELGILH